MYRFLCRLLPRGIADGLMVVWYTLLILLVIVFSRLSFGEFRYINL